MVAELNLLDDCVMILVNMLSCAANLQFLFVIVCYAHGNIILLIKKRLHETNAFNMAAQEVNKITTLSLIKFLDFCFMLTFSGFLLYAHYSGFLAFPISGYPGFSFTAFKCTLT